MKVTRRSFLAALASIPFVGRFVPSNVKPGSYVEVFIPLSEVHTFNGKVIPFDVFDPEAEAWGSKWARERYRNAIRYDGPEVFYKGLSLTERMKKAREYDQGDQWDAR